MYVRCVRYFLLLSVLFFITACQQQSPPLQNSAVNEQLVSIIAGTKYLKYQCNRVDLPDDDAIVNAAKNLAVQRKLNVPDARELAISSQITYERLRKDSTQEKVKCESFNMLLTKFIAFIYEKRSS